MSTSEAQAKLPTIAVDLPLDLYRDSAQLTLRIPDVRDARSIYEGTLESRDALERWARWPAWAFTFEGTLKRIRDDIDRLQRGELLPLAAFQRGTRDYVGSFELYPLHHGAYEGRTWIRTSMEGRSLAYEAMHARNCFGYQDLEANRIEGLTSADNVRAQRVKERSGYHLERIREDGTRVYVFPDPRGKDTEWMPQARGQIAPPMERSRKGTK